MAEPVDILVVEDDDDMARIIEFRLTRTGYRVHRVSDGEQAIRTLAIDPLPRMVTLDVMMPYKNGLAVLKEIRSQERTRTLPVLMLTSIGREQDIVTALEDGASDYLVKPIKPVELVTRVQRLIGKGKA